MQTCAYDKYMNRKVFTCPRIHTHTHTHTHTGCLSHHNQPAHMRTNTFTCWRRHVDHVMYAHASSYYMWFMWCVFLACPTAISYRIHKHKKRVATTCAHAYRYADVTCPGHWIVLLSTLVILSCSWFPCQELYSEAEATPHVARSCNMCIHIHMCCVAT